MKSTTSAMVMKPSASSPTYACPGRRHCQFGVRRRSESHRSVRHELATSPRSRTTWSIERAARCQLMARPEWPAPIMIAVADFTTLAPDPPSVDRDEHSGRIGNDVEDGGPLLRLRNQRLDVVFAGVGTDVEVDADGAEPVAHVIVDAENALNVHVGLERRLDRMKLDAAPLGDRGNARGQTARQAGQNQFNRRRSMVLGGENLGMVRLDGERLVPRLLGAEPEELSDRGAAVRAVQPLAPGAPLELRVFRRLLQRFARAEQSSYVDAVLNRLGRRGAIGHLISLHC